MEFPLWVVGCGRQPMVVAIVCSSGHLSWGDRLQGLLGRYLGLL